MTVEVVLVHRDQPERCAAAVAAFRSQGVTVTVTVVDNGSAPGAVDRLQALAPGVSVLANGANLGFGPGANTGLRRWLAAGAGERAPTGAGENGSASEWVVVAPHDAIPQPGCLRRLLAAAERRPRAGLVCAEFGTGFDLVPTVDKVIGGFYRSAHRGDGWQEVDYPHGTLLLARRRTLQEIGLFDERYFAYCEEVDLGLRARRAGWEVGLVWGAVVENGRLPPQLLADYLQVRNTLLLVRETFGWYNAGWRCLLAGWNIVAKAVQDPRLGLVHLRLEGRAVVDFLLRRFGPPPASVVALGTTAGHGRESRSERDAGGGGWMSAAGSLRQWMR
jgi:N-acetylglucosaminyl-diphospho-decaprenol L-rhamnosyltransferase